MRMVARQTVVEVCLSFICGVLGASVWFHFGESVYPDLHTIDLSGWDGLVNLLTHYALPIQIIATIFFYISLYLFKSMKEK